MKIEVTQEHIDKGLPEHCRECPIALALIDKFPFGTIVEAGRWKTNITCLDATYLSLSTPLAAKQFMDRFDQRQRVIPFSFELGPI